MQVKVEQSENEDSKDHELEVGHAVVGIEKDTEVGRAFVESSAIVPVDLQGANKALVELGLPVAKTSLEHVIQQHRFGALSAEHGVKGKEY